MLAKLMTAIRGASAVGLMIVLGVLTQPAVAADAVGKVLTATGVAHAVGADGAERALQRRSEIFAGDTLRTGADGKIQARFIDGAVIQVTPNSELRVDEYNFSGTEDGSESAALNLLKGGMRTITGAVGHTNKDNYKVTTRVATIGLRGTFYGLQDCAGECLAEDGSVLPNGVYGGVADGGITTDNGWGKANFDRDEYFHIADWNSQPRRLLAPPAVLSDPGSRPKRTSGSQSQDDSDDAAGGQSGSVAASGLSSSGDSGGGTVAGAQSDGSGGTVTGSQTGTDTGGSFSSGAGADQMAADNTSQTLGGDTPFNSTEQVSNPQGLPNTIILAAAASGVTPTELIALVQGPPPPPPPPTATSLPAGVGMVMADFQGERQIPPALQPVASALITGVPGASGSITEVLVRPVGTTPLAPVEVKYFEPQSTAVCQPCRFIADRAILAEAGSATVSVIIVGAVATFPVDWGRWGANYVRTREAQGVPLNPLDTGPGMPYMFSAGLTDPQILGTLEGSVGTGLYNYADGPSAIDHNGNPLTVAGSIELNFSSQQMTVFQVTATGAGETYNMIGPSGVPVAELHLGFPLAGQCFGGDCGNRAALEGEAFALLLGPQAEALMSSFAASVPSGTSGGPGVAGVGLFVR